MREEHLLPVHREIIVKLPDGTETDFKLKLQSTDSAEFHAVARRHAQNRLGREDRPSIDELAKDSAEQRAACIVGWTGLENAAGPIPYSREKAIELMSKPEYAYIQEQVEGFATQRANFFRQDEKTA